MAKNTVIISVLNLVFFFIGLTIAFGFSMSFEPFSILHPSVDFAILAIATFVMSMGFSGMLAPFLFLFFGFVQSPFIASNPLGTIVSVFPLLIAAYAGSLAGHFSSEDLREKGNLFDNKKYILTLFFAAVLSAIIAGLVFAYLNGIDQSGIFPFLYQRN